MSFTDGQRTQEGRMSSCVIYLSEIIAFFSWYDFFALIARSSSFLYIDLVVPFSLSPSFCSHRTFFFFL